VDDSTNTGTPEWRYWDPHEPPGKEWVDLGITGSVSGDQWHTLKLEGEILHSGPTDTVGKVHYLRFTFDGQVHSLANLTVDPAPAPGEEDRLAVAVQLDGNATQTPFEVFLDRVALTSPVNRFTYIPPYGTPIVPPVPGADVLTGRVQNVAPSEYYVVCYILVSNGWWIKPHFNPWKTQIDVNGNWGCEIANGGIDPTATMIETYLVPQTRMPGTSYPLRDWLAWNAVAKSVSARTKVEVRIGPSPNPSGSYPLTSWSSSRQSFPGLDNGPVKISSITSIPILGAERVIYKVNGVRTSYTEMMGLPNSQLATEYWLPWYNNVDLDTQLRIGNVSGSAANVNIYIGGQLMAGSPFALGAGASTRLSFIGVNSGPVRITSNVNIVAAERVIYKVNGVRTSFSELMAMPTAQLSATYWLPVYDNVNQDTQLRFANITGGTANVNVYIGGQLMAGSPFVLGPFGSTRVSFPGVNSGPVRIESNVTIVAAERVIYKVNGVNTSFSEMMGLPNSQLDKVYWLPWYNNIALDTQLRLANASNAPARVRIYIGGTECIPPAIAYPSTLPPGGSVRVSCPGVDNGLVKIVSTQKLVTAGRIIYRVNGVDASFTEMMALPNSQLNTAFWLPWYNNASLDTQLRFGVP
jgi:hypothetical protein